MQPLELSLQPLAKILVEALIDIDWIALARDTLLPELYGANSLQIVEAYML